MNRRAVMFAALVGVPVLAPVGTAQPLRPPIALAAGAVPDPPAAPAAPVAPAVPDYIPAESNPLAERLKPTFELRGRIEADAVIAMQSVSSKALIGDLQNGYGFRRARIGAQGNVGTSARWVAEIDFANGNFRPRDLYVALTALPGVRELQADFASNNLPQPTSGPLALAPNGAVLYQTTLGANWYLNDYTRLMFNYTIAVPEARGVPALPVHELSFRTAIWW